jgi:hypothetical protein
VSVFIAGARGCASTPLASRSRPERHRNRWLSLGVALAASACTLTADPFDPSLVDPGELERSSVESGLRPVPENEGTSTLLPPSNIDEGMGGSILLGPSETNGGQLGGLDQGTQAVDGGRTVPDTEPADAGGSVAADAASPATPVPVVSCAGQEFEGSCYEFFEERLAWVVAEGRCLALEGHLARVDSFGEEVFLNGWPAELGIFPGDGSGIWIGGTDAAQDNLFRWADGSPLSFSAWGQNQPDNGAGIDCIEKRNDATARWYDQRCSDERPYVCERPL